MPLVQALKVMKDFKLKITSHMNIKTLPITEARRRIFKLAQEVQVPGTSYVFTERGVSKVVLISVDEYASWLETMEVVRIFPNLEKDIKEAESQYKKGEYIILDDFLTKKGYTAVKKRNERHISNSSAKKGSKRFKKIR